MTLALVLLLTCAGLGLATASASRRAYVVAALGAVLVVLFYLNFPSSMT